MGLLSRGNECSDISIRDKVAHRLSYGSALEIFAVSAITDEQDSASAKDFTLA